jgi:glycosyltransferase involved in cell wall biosynthesis
MPNLILTPQQSVATNEWIAFLDDDDEWLPNKLERQIAFASGRTLALVSCLSRVVTPTATYVLPEVIYDNSAPIDEYLFDRRSLVQGFGLHPNIQFSAAPPAVR